MSALSPVIPQGASAPVVPDGTSLTGSMAKRDVHQIDPNVVSNDGTQGPGMLLAALQLQKWTTLRFLIDSRSVPPITQENNPGAFHAIKNGFLATQKSDGESTEEWDAEMFLTPRSLPNVPMVLREGDFQPLCPTPFSPATKPIALFNMADDWSRGKSQTILRKFRKSFLPFHAEIAKHFTVVRVVVGDPDQLLDVIERVKALLPGIPLLVWSLNGHGYQYGVKMGMRFLMTFSDVKTAFEKEVQTLLSKCRDKDPAEVRMQLLFAMASGKKRLRGQTLSLSPVNHQVIQKIGREIAFQGSMLFHSCSCAARDINLCRVSSRLAPGITVYGSPDTQSSMIPKIFYTPDSGTPQFVPVFLKEDFALGLSKMLGRAYRNGELRVHLSGLYARPVNTDHDLIPGIDDIERSAFMGVSLTEQEYNDPAWKRLFQALDSQSTSPLFTGQVPILAPTGRDAPTVEELHENLTDLFGCDPFTCCQSLQ